MTQPVNTRWTLLITCIFLLVFAVRPLPAANVGVGDPEIKTDDTYFPGELAMSTLPRVLQHAYSIPRGAVGSTTNRDKLIKVFLWRSEHFSHLDTPEVYRNPNYIPDPYSDNGLIAECDSLRGMFSYGYALCGTNHSQMRAIAEAAGWEHRRRGLNGDTGQEIGFGGLWRYVNTDQYTLHFLSNSASADFASLDQVLTTNHRYIEWNPDLGGGTFLPQAPTHSGYHTVTGHVIASIPFRSLQWQDYYDSVWDISTTDAYPMYAEGYYCTPMVYRLKRGETFTRWLKPDGIVTDLGLAGRCWWGFNHSSTSPHALYSFVQNAPARDQLTSGPEESQKGGGVDTGNGCYDWQPSLANGEYVDGLAAQTGTFSVGASPVLKATTAGTLVFEVSTPYTICGRPTQNNPHGWRDPAYTCFDGAMLYTTATGSITVDVSNDLGTTWISKGALTPTMDLTDNAKGRNGYMVRLNFAANAGLNSLRMRTITMLAQGVYPNLKNGTTTVTYSAGNTGMLDYSPNVMTAAAATSATGYVTKVDDSGVTYDGYPTTGSFVNTAYHQIIGSSAYITYKIVIPPALASAGATFKQIFAAQDTNVHVNPNPGAYGQIDIATSASGPWTSIAHYDIPLDQELSHFWTYGRSPDGGNLGGTTYYVRFTQNNEGSSNQFFRYFNINATYNLPTPTTPMDVTYYWNNGSAQNSTHTIPAGTTNTTWTIATGTVTGQQKVVFSVPSGGIAPPSITTQPASQTVTAPATATFSVVATGSGLTYQWKRNGAPIVGATSTSYTTGATSIAGDNGSTYTVDVTNGGGTVNSTIATLTVVAAGTPAITVQPVSQTVTEPATATFSVTATGATSYQWKRNGAPIVGATSASFTTGSTTVAGDNGAQFTVDVTNANGTVTSSIATLTVNPLAGPPVTVQLQDGLNSYTGTLDTFLNQFSPSSSYGTQQFVNVDHYDDGTGLSESTLGLLKFDLTAIPAGATVTSASLDVWLTRTNGISGSDTLVMDKVTGTWDESSTYAGGVPASTPSGVATPSLASVPNGSPLSPTYQLTIPSMATLVQSWLDTPGNNHGVLFSFASNENFRFSSREGAAAIERPRLTLTYTTGGSGAAPAITVQPASQTVTAPAAATFSVTATGATSYQWQLNGANIGGATSASLTINPTSTGLNGGVYRVLVTNANGTTTSNDATLTVNSVGVPPVINVRPADQTVTAPAAATFSVTATGATSYQWQLNGTNLAGATGASYTINPTDTGLSGGVYRVRVTNSNGTTTSNDATLTVNPAAGAPVITVQPASQTVTAPAGATFAVTATSATSYQWQLNGTNIGGATASTFTVSPTTTGMSGRVYRVLVTNANGTTTSNNATLTVNGSGANPIHLTISSLTMAAPIGSLTPVTATVTLKNTSGAPITVTAVGNASWLAVGGPITVPANSQATLSVIATPSNGQSGVYTATVTMTNSTGGSQTLPVSFTVGTQTGIHKRGCSVSNEISADGCLWILAWLGLGLVLAVRKGQKGEMTKPSL